MIKYPTIPIISHTQRTQYCAQNEPLQVVSTNGLVAIVETARGNRFPCLIELLSDEQVVVIVEASPVVEPEIFDQLRLF